MIQPEHGLYLCTLISVKQKCAKYLLDYLVQQKFGHFHRYKNTEIGVITSLCLTVGIKLRNHTVDLVNFCAWRGGAENARLENAGL